MAVRAASHVIQARPAVVFHRRNTFVPCLVEAPQLTLSRDAPQWEMPHNVWAPGSLNGVRVSAMQPHTLADRMAYLTTRAIQEVLDLASGFKFRRESSWLKRLKLLELAAAVPFSFSSWALAQQPLLRQTRLDRSWLQALSQQSNQATAHLTMVAAAAGTSAATEQAQQSKTWVYAFALGYLLWPRFGKWCVDHSQEVLIRVYAELLEDMDQGRVPSLGRMPAPKLAIRHYGLAEEASLRDVIEKIHLDDRLLL
ncbi:unnamed protein product [Durusdinium trenchii]|uniref:Alternative oxidase n=2 Tax=Durusdinium trenchii TaxID=1381693 RepID=A0ABP0P5Z2_9DINO